MVDSPGRWVPAVAARAMGVALGGALLLSASCMPPRRATVAELRVRAAFDMGCAPHLLQIYPLGARSRGVVGCGRRLTYVEECDSSSNGSACGWMLDTPTWVPPSTPPAPMGPAPAAPPPPVAGPPDAIPPADLDVRDLGY